ncbi:hypothetical protein NGA74_01770 [Lactobacillus helveticus]|uniref:hypothetical protein n=1 Tax=Lactobacillus helveticus TaxID=1587 RepID=UPI00207C9E9A|nr:hypothetical protein [Lactobacillus helveticus]MCO0806689.1 hypothetical protein [Lactobacillus helveticus]
MSQYNKTVLTNAGLELAKRANAGQAKFEITRAVTSADDWSNKTIQDLEEATAIPNIMQQGTIMDAEEVESNNSVIGVSLCFTNKDLSTSYQIKIIGLYVKEEGQDKDFLYAVTTAVSPEYMPGFGDKVLYRFNMQMYLVIGKAQAVNVVINEGTAVTHGQFDKYKSEVTADLEKIENTHKEDMSHVVKSASINDGDEILPDEAGKLKLVVPDPDLSKYVSLEQLTETLKTKADITAIPDKTATEEGIKQAKAAAKAADDKAQSALVQLPNKADTSTVNAQIADVKDTAKSNLDKAKSDLNDAINTKANSSDLAALDKKAVKSVGIYPNNLHFDSGSFNYWSGEIKASPDANGYALIDLTDDTSVRAATNQLNAMLTGLNHLQGTVNGKADKTDVASLQNTVNNIDSTRTPIVAGTSGDDLFAFKTNQIRLYNGIGNTCKNLPPAENIHWFSVQYVFAGPNDNGIAIYRTPFNEIWTVGCNAGSYTLDLGKGWLRVANSTDISNLQSTINQQNQTIQSLITRLNNAENEIRYIKDNYIEGKRFPASQEAQAEAWENEKPTRLAMIEK